MKKHLKGSAFLIFLLSFTTCMTLHANNTFPLFKNGKVASIYVSDAAEPQIRRAVDDLQNDVFMVTGNRPNIVHSITHTTDPVIVIGSVTQADIKAILKNEKRYEASTLKGLSEAFLLQAIENPTLNNRNVLVVAGSDTNGTIYGIYEISERIGVSPLYWWCDVVPQQQNEIVLKDCLRLPQEPSVRFRGIFINDEEALTQWSEKTSIDKRNGHPSPEIYERIFELLLRLKANTIWPAMMQRSAYFFEAKDETGAPINPRNAKAYGIYVGSSHCENLARNNWAEWHEWALEHTDKYDSKGVPVWDYTVNPKTIEAYWQERLDESKNFNMIYTLGIRGVHDSPFLCENLENPTLENKVKLLQKVINRQREMIKETFGSEDAVPQVFVPYEETGELYNGESKDGKEKCEGLKLPEDVIMVWTEDNFGYARQLPRPHEQKRAGGNGIYYHLAYQGGPTTYDWLYTTPLPLVQEEMRKVYDANARQFWMVNVGDIKPAEMGLQFFMELAYNINSYPQNTTKTFIVKSAKQQFGIGDNTANEIADLITEYHNLCRPKKPEIMTPFWDWTYENSRLYQYYSLFDFGDEALRQIESANELEDRAKAINDSLHSSAKTAFWHLVLYPIRSTRLMLEKTNYYRRNIAYAKQGRFASVNAYKALSENAEKAIQADLIYYKELEDGKWNGIMDPYADYNYKERIFDVANIPNNFVYEERYLEEAIQGIGSVCEGQVTGDENVELRFSSFEDNQRFIDVFNKDTQAHRWSIESDVPWLQFSKNKGVLQVEERLWVSVNWEEIPSGKNRATITVNGENGFSKTYPVFAKKYDFTLKENSYVEGNGLVAIEAEHYSEKHEGKVSKWSEYENFGYFGSSIFIEGGSKISSDFKANSARLEYSIYFDSTGTFYGQLYRIPTLNEGKGKTIEVAIGLNDAKPQVLTGIRHKRQTTTVTLASGHKEKWGWDNNVLTQMEKIPFEITVDKAGYNTLVIYQVDTGIGVDRVVICTDEQTKTAQRRSLLGAPNSYNNIGGRHHLNNTKSPKITKDRVRINALPNPAPLTEAKLNFAFYAMIDALGFIPVNQRHIYDPNKNQFGWRASDVNDIWYHHNEASERVPFWQRDGLTGKKETKFFVKLKKGSYRIKYHMGDARNKAEMIYFKGKNFDMTFTINGKVLMKNEKIISGTQKIETVEIEIGDDELLELTLSGNWILNALEIEPKSQEE